MTAMDQIRTRHKLTVYAVGNVGYDLRTGLPLAIFSTFEAAKTYAPDDVEWEYDEEIEEWYGRRPTAGMDWCIARYQVDHADRPDD